MSGVRFVALGDSITVGLGDPMPDRSWRGWAALLADCLAPPGEIEFHNLAESGALTHTLADRQLPAALCLRPTIAAVLVGVNDTLRGSFDINRTAEALNRTVGRLADGGALVLTARMPDPGRMLGLPAALARPLARRIRAVNSVTAAVSHLHGAIHLDTASLPETYDSRMWSVDRLHPSERGHRWLAASFADLLVARGVAIHHRPELEPRHQPPTRLASVRWMATKGAKWVYDRSTDLVPTLVAMSVAEWWYGIVGMARRLDLRLGAEADRAIAMLGGEAPPPESGLAETFPESMIRTA